MITMVAGFYKVLFFYWAEQKQTEQLKFKKYEIGSRVSPKVGAGKLQFGAPWTCGGLQALK